MPTFTFTCPICGITKTAIRHKSQKPPVYCSQKCNGIARLGKPSLAKKHPPKTAPRITVNCLNCGKEMQIIQSRLKDGRGKFCSKQCSSSYTSRGRKSPWLVETVKKSADARRGKPTGRAKPLVSFECEICHTSFQVHPYELKSRTPRYCSVECSNEARRRVVGTDHPLWTRVQRQCEWCGKTVWVKPAKLHEFRFCSKKCHGTYTSAKMAELKGATSIERALSDELTKRGIQHRTQHHIAKWLVDITIPDHRIAIEADGDYWHKGDAQKQKDENKNHWLEAHKWKVFRFTGTEIKHSPSDCIDRVVAYIQSLNFGIVVQRQLITLDGSPFGSPG